MLLPGVMTQMEPNTINRNAVNAAQTLTAATEAVINGSVVQIPDSGLKVGSIYKVRLAIDKTGAGSATSAYEVGIVPPGEAVAVANVDALLVFTKPAGTAAADVGIVEIELVVLAVGDAAEDGSVKGTFELRHNLAATGHAQVPVVVIAGADASTATILDGQGGGYIVLTITTGAADVSDVLYAEAELITPPASGF